MAIVQGRLNGQEWGRALGQKEDRRIESGTAARGGGGGGRATTAAVEPLLVSDVYLVDLVPAVSIDVDFEHVPEFELSIAIVNEALFNHSISEDMSELISDDEDDVHSAQQQQQ